MIKFLSTITHKTYFVIILLLAILVTACEIYEFFLTNSYVSIFKYSFLAVISLMVIVYVNTNYWMIKDILQQKNEGDLFFKQLSKIRTFDFTFKTSNLLINKVLKQNEEIAKATSFIKNIENGHLEANHNLLNNSSNEEDGLYHALTSMSKQMSLIAKQEKERNWVSEGLAKFADILRTDSELSNKRYDQIVASLIKYLQANQGGLYIVNQVDEKDHSIELVSFYAYERKKYINTTFDLREGLLGQAYLERDIIFITDVPENYIRITSGTGEATPRSILIVPLLLNEAVYGMIELASFLEFQPYQIDFVKKIGESIASSVLSHKINIRTRKLLEESQTQTSQMLKQEEEMRQNLEELHSTQEEMKRSEQVHLQEIERLQILYQQNLAIANEKNKELEQAEAETKELVAEIQASQEAIAKNYQILFEKFNEFNIQSKFDQLTSIRSTKKRNIEDYFTIIRNQLFNFASDRMIVDAMRAFKTAFKHLEDEVKMIPNKDEVSKHLREYYELEFLPRLNANSDNTETLETFWVDDFRTIYMQYLYISSNQNETGKKHLLDAPQELNEYSKLHELYHPIIRNFLLSFGYYDIFLIDSDTGHIVYSVFKEVDYTTSLITGPYKDTNFARAFREAKNSTNKDFIKLFDFEPYDPSYTAPASFISTPIFDGDKKIGVLIFQMPIDKINSIMTGDKKWQEDGLGLSGETYLVGDDYKMRSTSRFLIQDPVGYFNELQRIGYNDTLIKKIKRLNTTILLQDVKTEAVINALRGMCDKKVVHDYRNISVLSAYDKLNIKDVNWVICSDIDEQEVLESISYLKEMATN